MELLATAAQLRLWLDLPADDVASLPDDRAALLLEGASRAVLTYCRRDQFTEEEVTVRVDGNGGRELLLPGWPVTAVASVVEDPDGATPTDLLSPTAYVEWSADGILSTIGGGRFARRARWYEVTFTHGYPAVPEDVRNVVLRVAARAVSNPEGLATEGVGGYNAGFAFDDTRLPTLSTPDRRDLHEYRL